MKSALLVNISTVQLGKDGTQFLEIAKHYQPTNI